MKKVINGRVCNTDTARKIGSNQSETLYVTRTGIYFICNSSGDMSILNSDDAQTWSESYATEHFESENNLKTLRLRAGMTQPQLADAAGIFIRQVQRLESGERKVENLYLYTAKKLADALNVPVDDLLKTPESTSEENAQVDR